MIVLIAILCLAAGLFVGILAGAMCASGAAEDAYRKGFLGGYRKARREHAPD